MLGYFTWLPKVRTDFEMHAEVVMMSFADLPRSARGSWCLRADAEAPPPPPFSVSTLQPCRQPSPLRVQPKHCACAESRSVRASRVRPPRKHTRPRMAPKKTASDMSRRRKTFWPNSKAPSPRCEYTSMPTISASTIRKSQCRMRRR